MAKPVLTPLGEHSEVDSGNAEESWRPEPNVATRQVPLKGSVRGQVAKRKEQVPLAPPAFPVSPPARSNGSA